jgi:putative transposase
MTVWFRQQGHAVNPKRVARLMHTMGLATLDPKPRLSQPHPTHRIYPYWLRGVPMTRVNQVWSAEITYSRLPGGFVSLMAVMDWFSGYVLSWAGSITMDVGFGLEALEQALGVAQPELFHSDQGAQFTSLALTGRLAAAGSHMSMDGRGRALDNVFVERLWRTVQYEEVVRRAAVATIAALSSPAHDVACCSISRTLRRTAARARTVASRPTMDPQSGD